MERLRIKSWADLKRELKTMKPKSKLYELVKSEMKSRGRWKTLPRGEYPESFVSDKKNDNI